MTDFIIENTEELQEISLVTFMNALGYEPVYRFPQGLVAFSQPAFAYRGEARVSVNRAIKMHNYLAEETHANVHLNHKLGKYKNFRETVQCDERSQELVILFAGTTKIVENVYASFSKKDGLVFHKQQVKFMTKYDYKRYGSVLGF